MGRVHQTKDSMKNMLAQSGGGEGFKRLTIPEGVSTLRILWSRTIEDENGKVVKEVPLFVKDATHFVDMMENGKSVKKILHCPRALYGSIYPVSAEQRRCPLCEFVFSNSKTENPDVKKLVSDMKATERFLVNAMNMDTKEIGVLPLTWSMWKYIASITDSPSVPDNFDITSPWADEGGMNIIITKSGKMLNTKYEIKTNPIGATDIMPRDAYSTLPANIREKYGETPSVAAFRAAVEEYIESRMYDISEIVTPQTVAKYADLAAAVPKFGGVEDDYSEPEWAQGAGGEDVQAPTQYDYFEGVSRDFIREYGDVIKDFERKTNSELYTEAVKRGAVQSGDVGMEREKLLHRIFLSMATDGVDPVSKPAAAKKTPKDDSAEIAGLFGGV